MAAKVLFLPTIVLILPFLFLQTATSANVVCDKNKKVSRRLVRKVWPEKNKNSNAVLFLYVVLPLKKKYVDKKKKKHSNTVFFFALTRHDN